MKVGRRPVGPLSRAALHEAALGYLVRYAATAAGVRRVLHRRIDRWASIAEGDRADIEAGANAARHFAAEIVADLVRVGAIDDAAFAENRARSLARSGRSGRAIAAHLLNRGVDGVMAAASVAASPQDEVAAALALARRRRIGPFRAGGADAKVIRRESGVLARAGFSRNVVVEALATPVETAEALIHRLRSG